MKLHKTAKAITATALLASFTANAENTNWHTFQNVSHYADTVHKLTKENASVLQVFDAVERLTKAVEITNSWIAEDRYKMSEDKYHSLLYVRQLLDFCASLLVTKYEEALFSNYKTLYRSFSNALFSMDLVIQKVKEKQGKIKVVHIDGVSLSHHDIQEITHTSNKKYKEL